MSRVGERKKSICRAPERRGPRNSQPLALGCPLKLGEAKGALAQLLFKVLNRKMEKDPSDGDMLYIFHLPLRATAKATGGMITENMVKDFLRHANGHGFGEIFRMIGHNFSDKKKIKAYRKKLEQ